MSARFGGSSTGGTPVDDPPANTPGSDDPPADPVEVARRIALDALTAQPRTRAQLVAIMRKRGVPEDAAAAVLDRFDEVGLIDDAAFAASWVISRQRTRGLAPRALAHELRQRGVADPLIAAAVEAVPEDEVEAAARSLATRRATATRGLPLDVRVRRLAGMLARKGYSSAVALRVVREVLHAESADGGPVQPSLE